MASVSQTKSQIRSTMTKLKRSVPGVLATLHIKFFKANFRLQGFLDNSLSPWARRDPDRTPTKAILIQTNALRGGIRKKVANFKRVIIAVMGKARAYADFHNKGIQRTPTNEGPNLPRRQFMGVSKKLDRIVTKSLDRQIQKAFR